MLPGTFCRQLAFCVTLTLLPLLIKFDGHAFVQDKWQWLRHVSSEDIAFMNNLPFSISIPSHGCIVVHAGLVPGIALQDQDLMDLIEVHHSCIAETHRETWDQAVDRNRRRRGSAVLSLKLAITSIFQAKEVLL